MIAEYFVGITVQAEKLDVYFYPDQSQHHFSNDRSGINKLLNYVSRVYPLLILVQAEESHNEYMLNMALQAMRLPVLCMNEIKLNVLSERIHYVGETHLSHAGKLARMGLALRCFAEKQPHAELDIPNLQALFLRRKQLLEMRATEQNRLTREKPHHSERYTGKDIQTHILWLEEALEDLDSHLQLLWQM